MDNCAQFKLCPACGGLHAGPHACSPLALGRVKFHQDADAPRFTYLAEDDVRRIVREELLRLQNGER